MSQPYGAGEQMAGVSPQSCTKNYLSVCATFTRTMTPTKLRERLAESADSVDVEEFVAALEYVRDDGRRNQR